MLIDDFDLTESWKNNTPFYYYNKKWFAFISYNPKNQEIYISFVKGGKIVHPNLRSDGRKQMKIYYIDVAQDIDVREVAEIINQLKECY